MEHGSRDQNLEAFEALYNEQVDRLVRGSNPVANLEALEPIDVTALLQETTRRETMQTRDLPNAFMSTLLSGGGCRSDTWDGRP